MKLKEVICAYVIGTLRELNWNRTAAAKELGISIRSLRDKLNQYRKEGYEIPQPRNTGKKDNPPTDP